MLRYYFDLHAGSLSEWDDDGLEAENADEAVSLAKDMLVVAIARNGRLQYDRHAVGVIRGRSGNQIATATGTVIGNARVDWAGPSVSGCPLLETDRHQGPQAARASRCSIQVWAASRSANLGGSG
jgi:hypothetical protein